MAWIAGVDGCKGGWIAVYEDTDSGKLECRVAVGDRKAGHTNHDLSCAFEAVMNHHAPLAAVAVDMPIGLCNNKDGRDCDNEARDVLKQRRSSIFSAPAVGLFHKMKPEKLGKVQFYKHGSDLNEKLTGKGLSRQSWALVPKIAEIRDYLTTHPERQGCVHEVHPEVSFASMNAQSGGGRPFAPMRHPKAKAGGSVERRALLRRIFEDPFEELEAKAPECDFGKRAALDDFYDALACLWTARRIREKKARALPGCTPVGSMSLPMRIVY